MLTEHPEAMSRAMARELQFICEYIAHHGYSPTNRDIMLGTGASSTSVIWYHLQALEQAGQITRVPGQARSVRPTQRGEREL